MVKKETQMTEDAKLYELGFHIIPTGGDEKASEVFSVIEEIISKNNGEVVKSAAPKAIELAYTIITKIAAKNERFNTSYFGWIKFTTSSEDIELIKEEMASNEDVIRYIIVKTVDDDEHSTTKLVAEEESEDDSEEEEETEKVESPAKEESDEEVAE
jgi:ribosomal protein S6